MIKKGIIRQSGETERQMDSAEEQTSHTERQTGNIKGQTDHTTRQTGYRIEDKNQKGCQLDKQRSSNSLDIDLSQAKNKGSVDSENEEI